MSIIYDRHAIAFIGINETCNMMPQKVTPYLHLVLKNFSCVKPNLNELKERD